MPGLTPYSGVQQNRRISRELTRVSDQTDMGLARIGAGAELESARLEGLHLVATRAMQGVAMVSQLEQQLAQTVPIAASRLQAIGDIHALASAEVVSEATRRCLR